MSAASGASGNISIAVWDDACANAIGAPATDRQNARSNIDGRAVKDFEIRLPIKQNTSKVSRKINEPEQLYTTATGCVSL